MFNIVEPTLTEFVRAGRGRVFDEVQLPYLMQSESIIEKIFKSVLSSTTFIVTLVEIVQNMIASRLTINT